MKQLFLCAIVFLWMGSTSGEGPIVILEDGQLEGTTMETWQGRKISAFLGIPFAAPPVGPLRFQPPQPVARWQGTRDAGMPSPICTQYWGAEVGVLGIEDCLYLDVYTPQLSQTQGNDSLPVLVVIYQGSFMVGASRFLGPRYLLDYNLILVIMNYRVGILGFLSTGDSVVPGNMGLKDQVAALKWVQSNIQNFGGNPNEVTIAGASAGGQSVSYHFISSLSQSLFKRGISMSGSCLQPSAQQQGRINKTVGVAAAFNCPINSSAEIVSCLQNVPVESLVLQEGTFQLFYYTPIDVFGPTVEPDIPGAFISQLPYELIRTGEVFQGPILYSTTTQEGLVPGVFFMANETGLNYVNNNWNEVAPALLDYIYTVSSENRDTVSQKIREYYFGNQSISLATNRSLIQMLGDRTWEDDVETNARLQAYVQSSPVYYYHFGYRGQYSAFNLATGSNLNFGVSHSDDLMYVLNSTLYPPAENTPSDRAMIRIMSSLWANFIINGTINVGENVEWLPINRTDAMSGPLNYLFITSPTSLEPSSTLTFGNPTFWNNLPINEPGSGRPAYSGL